MKQHPEEVKLAARSLFFKKYKPKEIAAVLDVPARTVHHWKKEGQWEDMIAQEGVEESIARRVTLLIDREGKTETELKELDRLFNLWERAKKMRLAQIAAERAGEAPPKQPIIGGRTSRPKKKRGKIIKNDVSHLTAEDFKEKLHGTYYKYQLELREAKHHPVRNILKSRQIGATWYFAQEAFEDACLTGDDQIFLSATRAQAEVFRDYIVEIAEEKFGIELKGRSVITLHTAHGKAKLRFLSNNSKSAQSYHGHVYIDEYFWITKFEELYKVASAMAAHKKWRKTLFSSPSAVTHDAYERWTGDLYNKRWKKKRVEFPSLVEMKKGVECPDGVWRKVITIDDAERGGCDLFDLKQLKLEYSPDEFSNLFMCRFVDDTLAVFRLADLERCYSDESRWKDFDRTKDRPFGSRPVWAGFDPSRTRDDASFVIIAPPEKPGGTFRILERFKWVGKSFTWQAQRIRELTKRYNIQHMGIDVTGPGQGVFDIVKQFYPLATAITYSLQSKNGLVLKAKEVIEGGKMRWDASLNDISHAFLTIRQGTTGSGLMTYSAKRTATTGHADVAWAVMHALINEKINAAEGSGSKLVIG